MDNELENSQDLVKDMNKLVEVRVEKLKELQEAGKDPFEITKFNVTANSKSIKDSFVDPVEGEESEPETVSIAGRLMSKRGQGKVAFCDLQDHTGRIQLYIKKDLVGEETYDAFKKYDIGDIIGIEGTVFRTHMGEISLKVSAITLLTKSLRPLPEKWHGLKDVDLRYRQRYVDLIVNPEVKETFLKRTKILREIKNYLDNLGYIEVDTPILNVVAGGASARPFVTHHNTLDMPMYLRIANELYLKRLIVGGFDRVYEMGRMFRNEGMDVKHNPEFTNIEMYAAYQNYFDMMDLTEDLISTVCEKVNGATVIDYQGTEINLTKGTWRRITMADAIKEVTGIDMMAITTDEEARNAAKSVGVEVAEDLTWGYVLNTLFEEKVEETLIQPTFIYDYPVEVSHLTKKKPTDHRLTERFEVFIGGREYGNAYSELNDPIDQRERFMHQAEQKAKGDDEACDIDEDFINSLEYGMPPTGGLGIGVDRLIMLLTNQYSIRDILLFPTMKPISK